MSTFDLESADPPLGTANFDSIEVNAGMEENDSVNSQPSKRINHKRYLIGQLMSMPEGHMHLANTQTHISTDVMLLELEAKYTKEVVQMMMRQNPAKFTHLVSIGEWELLRKELASFTRDQIWACEQLERAFALLATQQKSGERIFIYSRITKLIATLRNVGGDPTVFEGRLQKEHASKSQPSQNSSLTNGALRVVSAE